MLTDIHVDDIVKIVNDIHDYKERRNAMTDIELLLSKIKESGMTMIAIAEKSGIDRATIYNRLKGKGEFTASEIVNLSSVLHLSKADRDKIFLSNNVN